MLERLVHSQLVHHASDLSAQFHVDRGPVRCRFAVLDNVLSDDTCRRIHAAFPPVESMRLMDTFRERKYTSKAVDQMDPIVGEALFAFQTKPVLEAVGRITGIPDLLADASFYAGGISAMTRGQFLNPHIDNSHEATRTYYRRLNLLYYVTPGWQLGGGGNLELWDEKVSKPIEIASLFNRLVIMETNRHSWHSVNPVRQDGRRCCVSNYFFTKASPEARHYFHVTSFSARPEQPLTRLWCSADNLLRGAVRMLKRDGLGQKDVYEKKAA